MHMQVVETPVAGEVRHYQMLMGGEWVDAQSGRTFASINPYTGMVWAVAPEASEADVDAAVRAARAAFDDGPSGLQRPARQDQELHRHCPGGGRSTGHWREDSHRPGFGAWLFR